MEGHKQPLRSENRPFELQKLVCVIDDDASFRRLCRTILASEGFQCDIVEDPGEAIAHVARTQPDVILMDLRLGPDHDAVAMLEAFSEAGSSTANIPIVICTASTDLIAANHALLERLSCEVVEKPFDIEALLLAIERCLARRGATADR